jgi:zinc and cadmium transporter
MRMDTAHHHHPTARRWLGVLTGDSVHCFGDGILIASAFMADMRLGVWPRCPCWRTRCRTTWATWWCCARPAANRRMALVKVSLAGAVTALGGVVGYFLVGQLHDYLPYFLAVASSSFVYVALADLIPQLQKRLSARETAAQIVWLLVGMGAGDAGQRRGARH